MTTQDPQQAGRLALCKVIASLMVVPLLVPLTGCASFGGFQRVGLPIRSLAQDIPKAERHPVIVIPGVLVPQERIKLA